VADADVEPLRARGFKVEGMCATCRPAEVQASSTRRSRRSAGRHPDQQRRHHVGGEPETMPLDKWQKVIDTT
jgi:hypothetical protein